MVQSGNIIKCIKNYSIYSLLIYKSQIWESKICFKEGVPIYTLLDIKITISLFLIVINNQLQGKTAQMTVKLICYNLFLDVKNWKNYSTPLSNLTSRNRLLRKTSRNWLCDTLVEGNSNDRLFKVIFSWSRARKHFLLVNKSMLFAS